MTCMCRNELISQKSRTSLFQPLFGLSCISQFNECQENCVTAHMIAAKELAGVVMASLLHGQGLKRLFVENFDLKEGNNGVLILALVYCSSTVHVGLLVYIVLCFSSSEKL